MLRFSIACLAFSLVLTLCPSADAKPKIRDKGIRAAAGKIYTARKKFPQLKTRRIKQKTTRDFWENKETKKWTIYFTGYFRRPLNDMEATIKLIDTTDRDHVMVASFEQYFMARGARSISSRIVMSRERFGVNRRILLTVEDYQGRLLASGTFRIGGKVAKRSRIRTVDFTEEETR